MSMWILGALATLGLACAPEPEERPVREGPREQDPQDSGDPQDTGEPQDTETDTDTSEPQDTGDPVDPGLDRLCFPGPAMDWSVCFDLVDYESSWGADYDYPDPLNGSAQYSKPLRFLDLSKVTDVGQKLAPNFTFGEFLAERKGRYGILQPHLVERLQELRNDLGSLSVNSGYRNIGYNAGVGGASYSRHVYGDAADLDPGSVSLGTLGAACDTNGAGYVGYYETHVHCDWRDSPQEPAIFDPAPVQWGQEHPLPELSAELHTQSGRFTAPAEGWDEGEPLREWVALDAHGNILESYVGRSYAPPEPAAAVQVVVGREIQLLQAL
ncbi:MAG: hypothetical protein ACI9VR_000939 [Cognaticolwellia sp.]|jgi:hypothetical protein